MRRSFTHAEIISACALEHNIECPDISTIRIPFVELRRQLRDMDEHHALRCMYSLKIRYTHADKFFLLLHAAKRGWVRVFRHVIQNVTLTRQEIALLHMRTRTHEIARMLQNNIHVKKRRTVR
jgi:hypothetical protein